MQRVVILFPGALGDALLALPAWRILRRRNVGAHLTLAVNDPLCDLMRACRIADAVERLDGPALAGLFRGGAAPRWLADRPVVYSWFGATDPEARGRLHALAKHLTLARVERGSEGPHAALAYATHIGEAPTLAEVTGLSVLPRELLALDGHGAPFQSARVAPLLTVHAGAGAMGKRWPIAEVRAVVCWWRQRGGRTIELRGPAEVGCPLVGADGVLEGEPLPRVAARLAATDVYLGNDSGVSHLAGAAGARGVVVFGPTAPSRWRPLGGSLQPVAVSEPADFPGAPLGHAAVAAALEVLLDGSQSPHANLDKPGDGI
jgi:heptosyltransferase III